MASENSRGSVQATGGHDATAKVRTLPATDAPLWKQLAMLVDGLKRGGNCFYYDDVCKTMSPESCGCIAQAAIIAAAADRIAALELALDEAADMAGKHRAAALDFKYRSGAMELPSDSDWGAFSDRMTAVRTPPAPVRK